MSKPHYLDIIEIINPTKTDFTEPEGKADHANNKAEVIKYGGHPYAIKAGEKKTYQRFLADHVAKHITDYALRDKPKQYNDEDLRKEWWNKIQIGTVNEFQPGDKDDEGARIAAQQDEIARQQEDRIVRLEKLLDENEKAKKQTTKKQPKKNERST